MMLIWWVWTLVCLVVVIVDAIRILAPLRRWFLIALSMLAFRLLYLPLDSQDVVGHSAQYLDVFHGQLPTVGDSTFYPALQIVWFLFGKFSFGLIEPRLLSALLGIVSIWLLSVRIKSFDSVDKPMVYWLPMVWLFLLPEHIFWSHSMYNVVFPFVLLALSVRAAQMKRWYILSAAMAMAVACRMETVLFWGMLLFYLPIWNWRVMLQVSLGTVVSLLLLSSMQIPGDGEYWDSIAHNWWFVTYYTPYAIVLIGAVLTLNRQHGTLFGWCALWLLGHHMALSTFNDFSSRHVLVNAIVVMIVWSDILGEQSRKWVRYPLIFGIVFNGGQLLLNRGKLLLDDSQFQESIQSVSSNDVPDLTLQQAQSRGCAWIVEMEPISLHPTQPVRSHFNVLNPLEVRGLLIEYGCIDWCYTIQDWGWTELGVQDRSERIEQMYEWLPVAIVREADAVCLLRSMVTDVDSLEMNLEHVH